MSKPFELTVTDAHDLVSKKILINRMSAESLRHQIECSKASIKLHAIIARLATKKLELIEKLTVVLERQLSNFDDLRQEECQDLYKYINELDEPAPEHLALLKTVRDHDQAMLTLLPKIQHIESTIPKELTVTNYKIKRRVDDCAEPAEELV